MIKKEQKIIINHINYYFLKPIEKMVRIVKVKPIRLFLYSIIVISALFHTYILVIDGVKNPNTENIKKNLHYGKVTSFF